MPAVTLLSSDPITVPLIEPAIPVKGSIKVDASAQSTCFIVPLLW